MSCLLLRCVLTVDTVHNIEQYSNDGLCRATGRRLGASQKTNLAQSIFLTCYHRGSHVRFFRPRPDGTRPFEWDRERTELYDRPPSKRSSSKLAFFSREPACCCPGTTPQPSDATTVLLPLGLSLNFSVISSGTSMERYDVQLRCKGASAPQKKGCI
jgi:hypothetical protein